MQTNHHSTRFVIAVGALLLAGCGSVRHVVQYDREFDSAKAMKVEVGPVVIVTGQSYESDIVPLFRNALSKDLSNDNLLWSSTDTVPRMVISTRVVEYEPGYSLKRWLIPGWGTALCTVHCELKHSETHTLLGSIDVRRTISIGRFAGWRAVVTDVAADVATQIKRKIKSK